MDFSEAADRISRKFQKSGQTIDPKKIEGKLRRLIEEFSVQPAEAERSVTNELAKEFNIPSMGTGSAGSGGTGSSGTEDKKIADAAPGEWVTIEGKIVALAAPASPSIAQGGIIADDSGAIRFVVWAKANAPVMAVGSWYRIESAVVDEFKGIASLKIHSGTTIKEIEEDRALMPTTVPISELHPGIGSLRAKVVQEWDVTHERMLQSGLLGDETGTLKFVIWKEPGKESLIPGSVYNIFYAQVDEYNGRLSLNLNTAMIMQEEGDIVVSGGEAAVNGGTGSRGTEEKKIADAAPGEWVTIEGKIVALAAPASPSIAQGGIIADDSGAIRFVVWAKANAPVMAVGSWYRIESAVVDEFKGIASLKIHSDTIIKEIEEDRALMPTTVPISKLHPGIGSIRAKVVKEWDVTHEQMLQSGLFGDETGTLKFVIWKEPGKESLIPGSVYNIFYAHVDKYNGRLSLDLTNATIAFEDGDIEIKSETDEISGAIVHISPGSGLIKRCPVEGCNRTLSRQNYCPVHEIQPKFNYDLRIKGWFDDGVKTYNLLIKRELVESLTGITLEDAIKIAETNPLGLDEVFGRMREMMLGRYLVCIGRNFDEHFLVDACTPKTFKSEEHTALLNIAGGAS